MNLFDMVALTVGLPDEGLPAGSVGTIVHVFDQPRRAYEVEFVDEDGETIATAAVRPEQLRQL
ncbi:DUF4926 domain-containing protein [Micromonospora sp. NPDC049559]|uniref:DUF4926 domain-containing protein n=1 Tax=Micromonospora sp. NPDC049559 TaxID=3155923 RepID=UPI00341BD789